MAIINPTIFAAGGGVKASLVVSTEKGALVSAVNGSNVVKGVATEEGAVLKLPVAGTWSVTASMGGTTAGPKNVVISEEYPVNLPFESVYGVSRNINAQSPVWTRTDDAVGMSATASVGEVAGYSDFDHCYPWSEMRRETLSTGDVMVKIPEFWYQRKVEEDTEYIRISNVPREGFEKHPGSGKYVGAYKTSSDNKSVPGEFPTVNKSRTTMRENAKKKGFGWGLIDVVTNSAIQMLYVVEYADNNSQEKIGRGRCDHSNSTATYVCGSCDSVPNLTGRPSGTEGMVDVVYRGIEGIWGNVSEFLDGLNFKHDTNSYYVCTDPSKYADDTYVGYTQVSFASPASDGYISKEGMDNALPWAMLPSEATGGFETTFYSDYFNRYAASGVAERAGRGGSQAGIWYLKCYKFSTVGVSITGSCLRYDPS